ncbi:MULTISPECIES: glutamate ABC transporter substrate-binding protein [Arthrobacter]|uniref:Glutamate ABC transporter substrate-binding protein n=1 Tax=Arthrobacter jinronghuae TaxID=2964609 RepID=A0ABT1NP33_9MICC|nr:MULTISPECIES: glutamate ABC transporter substrate-binding protein [Arthrobacter]MCQ1949395.1 glutamate ABC transporter substrate-binding protein [Arthrobacter jinronghuae]MCQ1952715.1 glutamate ABC transporter substrate-binding protein [Arthrobacter sp. zg-Y238]MCQ1955164.1 glutamate ABC transporter substrate-binding protein [Arthrobacter jinronghuae]UWX77829.1 glutamate ABC transporter substrate-binding protein [Arthrobacter jinronghuae]
MRKTRYAAAAIAAVAALTLSACGGDSGSESGSSEAATEGSGEQIRIGIKFDQPGLGFDEGGNYAGFDVDVAKYVANELGYPEDQIKFISSPSAQRENMLENDQLDMIFATYSITDARKEKVAFAGPYFVAGQDLLVPVDSDISGPEDLDGKNLCSVTGSTSAQKIKDNYAAGVNLLEQPSYAECVTAMQGGSIDAVTTDDIILAGLASTDANKGQFKVVGNTFSEEKYGVGLPKEGGIVKCEDINAAITKMVQDGAWEEAIKKNTEGADYTFNEDLNPPTPDACA